MSSTKQRAEAYRLRGWASHPSNIYTDNTTFNTDGNNADSLVGYEAGDQFDPVFGPFFNGALLVDLLPPTTPLTPLTPLSALNDEGAIVGQAMGPNGLTAFEMIPRR